LNDTTRRGFLGLVPASAAALLPAPQALAAPEATATGLDGESVRNVRVLERFAFVEVPAAEAQRVVDLVGGTTVRGHALRLEAAKP